MLAGGYAFSELFAAEILAGAVIPLERPVFVWENVDAHVHQPKSVSWRAGISGSLHF
jgi:hypothetical protein